MSTCSVRKTNKNRVNVYSKETHIIRWSQMCSHGSKLDFELSLCNSHSTLLWLCKCIVLSHRQLKLLEQVFNTALLASCTGWLLQDSITRQVATDQQLKVLQYNYSRHTSCTVYLRHKQVAQLTESHTIQESTKRNLTHCYRERLVQLNSSVNMYTYNGNR